MKKITKPKATTEVVLDQDVLDILADTVITVKPTPGFYRQVKFINITKPEYQKRKDPKTGKVIPYVVDPGTKVLMFHFDFGGEIGLYKLKATTKADGSINMIANKCQTRS